jgi:hypothetical protein
MRLFRESWALRLFITSTSYYVHHIPIQHHEWHPHRLHLYYKSTKYTFSNPLRPINGFPTLTHNQNSRGGSEIYTSDIPSDSERQSPSTSLVPSSLPSIFKYILVLSLHSKLFHSFVLSNRRIKQKHISSLSPPLPLSLLKRAPQILLSLFSWISGRMKEGRKEIIVIWNN